MNKTNNFFHHIINYRKLSPNSKIFIPLDAFSPHPTEESEIGEYLGSITAGVAHMAGMNGIATALHLIEMLEPAFEVDRLNLSHEKTRTLQFMYNNQRIRNPHGRGTRPGIWIDAQTAYDMGLIRIPRELGNLHAQFNGRLQDHRAHQIAKASATVRFQTTNDYSNRNRAPSYGRFGRRV